MADAMEVDTPVPTPPPTEGVKKKRFEVKKWTGVAFWSWDSDVDTCAICRNNIMDTCIECQASRRNQGKCNVSWGMCNHIFHSHCISKWLESRPVCPLDNKVWELKKYSD